MTITRPMCMYLPGDVNWSSTSNQPPAYVSVRNNNGFKTPEIATILRLVQRHRGTLCEMWKGIHGDI